MVWHPVWPPKAPPAGDCLPSDLDLTRGGSRALPVIWSLVPDSQTVSHRGKQLGAFRPELVTREEAQVPLTHNVPPLRCYAAASDLLRELSRTAAPRCTMLSPGSSSHSRGGLLLVLCSAILREDRRWLGELREQHGSLGKTGIRGLGETALAFYRASDLTGEAGLGGATCCFFRPFPNGIDEGTLVFQLRPGTSPIDQSSVSASTTCCHQRLFCWVQHRRKLHVSSSFVLVTACAQC